MAEFELGVVFILKFFVINNIIFSLIKVELLSFCMCVRVRACACLLTSLLLFGIFSFSFVVNKNILLILI
jgi:hypothetical protein